MKKIVFYILIPSLVIIVISAIFLRDYLSGITITTDLPPRANNINKNALWVGGPDGGVYVLIKKNTDNSRVYDALIYDSAGKIEYKGSLKINSSENAYFNISDVNAYSGWDGDTLHLQDGRMLSIIEK